MKSTIKLLVFTILASINPINSIAQSEPKTDKGNINLHTSTVLLYSTMSIGYESIDLAKRSARHSIRPLIRIGVWNARLSVNNVGVQSAIGFSYVLGSKNHHFEHSSEFVSHFDKGLKGQSMLFIAGTYRPFIGYRYDSQNKRFIFRIGVGWKEALQVGLGYKLQ